MRTRDIILVCVIVASGPLTLGMAIKAVVSSSTPSAKPSFDPNFNPLPSISVPHPVEPSKILPRRAIQPTKTRKSVPTPRNPKPIQTRLHPYGATAKCNDGTYSYSKHHQGSCSHHQGVAEFL